MSKKGEKEYWSMTEGVFNCLIDKKRTLAFKKAIYNTVKKGDIVVDMGTGSGILSMFASDAGAKKVYAIENNRKNFKTLVGTFKANNFSNKIKLIKADARKVKLPEKVDVIIGEMIATALIEEQQIPAIHNILKYGSKKVKILLKSYENYIDLVYSKDVFYGYKVKNIKYEYTGVGEVKSVPLSNKKMYCRVDFNKAEKESRIDKKILLNIIKKGKINAVRLSSKTIFFDNSTFDYSFAYSYPIILPADNFTVNKGDKFLVEISYILCGGFDSLKYKITKKINVL
jgi:predicted RNA methylase